MLKNFCFNQKLVWRSGNVSFNQELLSPTFEGGWELLGNITDGAVCIHPWQRPEKVSQSPSDARHKKPSSSRFVGVSTCFYRVKVQ